MARRTGKRSKTVGLDLNKMKHDIRMYLLRAGMEVVEELADKIAEEANLMAPVIKDEVLPSESLFGNQPLRRGPNKQGNTSSGPIKNATFSQKSEKVPNSFLVCCPAWYAHFVEYGTTPHTIYPKKKKSLRFPGTNGYLGLEVLTDVVDHPGITARPFLRPAGDKADMFVDQIAAKRRG